MLVQDIIRDILFGLLLILFVYLDWFILGFSLILLKLSYFFIFNLFSFFLFSSFYSLLHLIFLSFFIFPFIWNRWRRRIKLFYFNNISFALSKLDLFIKINVDFIDCQEQPIAWFLIILRSFVIIFIYFFRLIFQCIIIITLIFNNFHGRNLFF